MRPVPGLRPWPHRRIVARMRLPSPRMTYFLLAFAMAALAALWLANLAHNDFGIPRHTIRADALLCALLVFGLLLIGSYSHRLGRRG
jgi:hypothetical protein